MTKLIAQFSHHLTPARPLTVLGAAHEVCARPVGQRQDEKDDQGDDPGDQYEQEGSLLVQHLLVFGVIPDAYEAVEADQREAVDGGDEGDHGQALREREQERSRV